MTVHLKNYDTIWYGKQILFSASVYGFGMGLPLVKQIVTEHLGEIELHSIEGQGTVVKLSFPERWTDATGRKETSKTGSG